LAQKAQQLRLSCHQDFESLQSFVQVEITVKSDKLIQKKGAIAFENYGNKEQRPRAKLTTSVQRTREGDRGIAKWVGRR
jgi:hypothetical protein